MPKRRIARSSTTHFAGNAAITGIVETCSPEYPQGEPRSVAAMRRSGIAPPTSPTPKSRQGSHRGAADAAATWPATCGLVRVLPSASTRIEVYSTSESGGNSATVSRILGTGRWSSHVMV